MSSDKTKKEIKTLVVVAKKTIMKIGETIIPAPIGVKIDPKTGELLVPVDIKPVGDAVLTPTIEKKLLINEGFIKLKLFFKVPDPKHCPDVKKGIIREVIVPLQSVQEVEQIRPDDDIQEEVKIKAITIRGIPDDTVTNIAGKKINLIIKVIIKVKLIISRKKVMPIPQFK